MKMNSYQLKMLAKCMGGLLAVEGYAYPGKDELMELYSVIHSKLRFKHKKRRGPPPPPDQLDIPESLLDVELAPPPPVSGIPPKLGPIRSKFPLLHNFDQEK